MRELKRFGHRLGAMVSSLVLVMGGIAFAFPIQSQSITMATPLASKKYLPKASIGAWSGTYSWGAGNATINSVEVFTLLGGGDPLSNTVISSSSSLLNSTQNSDGSGSGTYTASANPVYAPSTSLTDFYLVAAPSNAAVGYFIESTGMPLRDGTSNSTQ